VARGSGRLAALTPETTQKAGAVAVIIGRGICYAAVCRGILEKEPNKTTSHIGARNMLWLHHENNKGFAIFHEK
jgi:hypothetical protein